MIQEKGTGQILPRFLDFRKRWTDRILVFEDDFLKTTADRILRVEFFLPREA